MRRFELIFQELLLSLANKINKITQVTIRSRDIPPHQAPAPAPSVMSNNSPQIHSINYWWMNFKELIPFEPLFSIRHMYHHFIIISITLSRIALNPFVVTNAIVLFSSIVNKFPRVCCHDCLHQCKIVYSVRIPLSITSASSSPADTECSFSRELRCGEQKCWINQS